MNRAAFSARSMADAFAEFGAWLQVEVGPKKAALSIHRYLPFFIDIENLAGAIPRYDQLLSRFGAERLRRMRMPMRWMQVAKGMEPDSTAQKQDSERKRIAAIMEMIPEDSVAGRVLSAYRNQLIRKSNEGNLSLRSIRLALRPAASLLLAADPGGGLLPNQACLNAYLQSTPGQRAALSGFLVFLREAHMLHLIATVNRKRVQKLKQRKLEQEMLGLMGGNCDTTTHQRKWLSIALAYFHGLPRKVGATIPLEQIATDPTGGLSVTWNGRKYWIPENCSDPVQIHGYV